MSSDSTDERWFVKMYALTIQYLNIKQSCKSTKYRKFALFVIHLLASTNVKKNTILFYKLLSSVKEVLNGSKFIKSNAFVRSLFFHVYNTVIQ